MIPKLSNENTSLNESVRYLSSHLLVVFRESYGLDVQKYYLYYQKYDLH